MNLVESTTKHSVSEIGVSFQPNQFIGPVCIVPKWYNTELLFSIYSLAISHHGKTVIVGRPGCTTLWAKGLLCR